MPKPVRLRRLTQREQRVLGAKLRDLSLSVRVHQRYRVVDEVHKGRSVLEAAERVGCHFTVAYAWVGRFNDSGFDTFEMVPNPKGRPPILLRLVGCEVGRVLPIPASASGGDR
jgi:hypothetical protein